MHLFTVYKNDKYLGEKIAETAHEAVLEVLQKDSNFRIPNSMVKINRLENDDYQAFVGDTEYLVSSEEVDGRIEA